MYRETRIHVVIPAYNVALHIAGVVKGVPDFVDGITVVDDGSHDATADAARAVGDRRVRVVRHEVNQGVGGAMISGFADALAAGDGIIVKMDGDGQMDPAMLTRLLDPIVEGRCGYTKGNRFLFARELSTMPRRRLVGNFSLTFLTKWASGYWHVFDPQNGYLAIASSALRLLELDRLSRRWFFENDMLINLNVHNVPVADIPIPARYGDERSSMSIGRVLVSFPFHLARGYGARFYRKYVLRDFSPIALFMLTGVPLLLFGIAFGGYTWIQSWRLNRFASTGTVMLSVLPFIVGFQLILQALVLEMRESPGPR